jgi:ABC-2 type transport system permease protein
MTETIRTISDLQTLVGRALRLTLRNVDGLLTALMLPPMLMFMFVYFFGGAIHTGGSYIDYVVPGVLLVCVGFGAGTTAVSVAHDLSGAIVDRLRSMDVRGESLIAGHVAASVVRNLASAALAVAFAVAIGYRPHASAAHWLAALAILTLFVVAISWLAAAIAIVVRSPEAAQGITFVISFLPYPSSAFVPVSTMPSWLQPFAAHQPITETVDAIRMLLGGSGRALGSAAWTSIAWSGGIIAVSIVLSGVLFARRGA